MPPHPSFNYLNRYRQIIPQWDAFMAAVQQPLPLVFWANPQRTDAHTLLHRLHLDEEPQPLNWIDDAWRLPPDIRLGGRWEFFAGLYYIQEETSLMATALLDAQPGERILDLCASPGGKTAKIGIDMGNSGTLIANDFNWRRLKGLRQTIERMGLLNTTITTLDGTSIPNTTGGYDRILVDAPCTCEGTLRKQPRILAKCSAKISTRQARTQTALLRKAVQLVKPGGRIVYSTCTFAPEENEVVVSTILREYAGKITLLPAHIPGVTLSPGITTWNQQHLGDQLAHCGRIWPHQHDSGGFFLAVLQRHPDTTTPTVPGEEATTPTVPGEEATDTAQLLASLITWYGLPSDTFDNLQVITRDDGEIFLANADHHTPTTPRLWQTGIVLGRMLNGRPKIDVPSVLSFCQQATRQVLDITPEQATRYIHRDMIDVTDQQVAHCATGHVLLRHGDMIIGLGDLLRDDRGTLIRSLFPKRWQRTRRG